MELVPHLNSVSIRGFRAFRQLDVAGIADVNLVVGGNNQGKTCFLEALNLYFNQGDRSRIWELLFAREEFSLRRTRLQPTGPRDVSFAYESLFFGRPDLDTKPYFKIGPNNNVAAMLAVSFSWLQELWEDTGGARHLTIIRAPTPEIPEVVPGLEIVFGDQQSLVTLDRLDQEMRRPRPVRVRAAPVVFLTSAGMQQEEMGRIWDSIALTEDEQTVLTALSVICPSIEKLVLIQNRLARHDRTLMVKLNEFTEPVPFKSLGDGVERLLNIVLALFRARGGTVLIDEIENGIHYSMQPSLWSIIFEQASLWNIQVFATTHSWDCVEGFQIAASSQNGSAALFRLEARGSQQRAVRFAPSEIEIARKESIEVR